MSYNMIVMVVLLLHHSNYIIITVPLSHWHFNLINLQCAHAQKCYGMVLALCVCVSVCYHSSGGVLYFYDQTTV